MLSNASSLQNYSKKGASAMAIKKIQKMFYYSSEYAKKFIETRIEDLANKTQRSSSFIIENILMDGLLPNNEVVLCQEKVQIKHELFTLIFYFVSMLLQFLNVLISASTSFHIHLAKCIRSDYVFLLYYKMPLCIQI